MIDWLILLHLSLACICILTGDDDKCPNVTVEVCGRDGKTYLNDCEARYHGAEINCDGKCPCPEKGELDGLLQILFSLVQVQNQSFGLKRNAKHTVDPPTHHPPTENFSKGSRLFIGQIFGWFEKKILSEKKFGSNKREMSSEIFGGTFEWTRPPDWPTQIWHICVGQSEGLDHSNVPPKISLDISLW